MSKNTPFYDSEEDSESYYEGEGEEESSEES